MISLTLSIILVGIILIFIILFVVCTRRRQYVKGYWKGRGEGWHACEDMAIERAEKHGYNKNKFLSDILQ